MLQINVESIKCIEMFLSQYPETEHKNNNTTIIL